MKKIEKAKEVYEKMEIPEELSSIVNQTIREDKSMKSRNFFKYLKIGGVLAAASFGVFVLGLNTSEAFATKLKSMPVIGNIAEVLTIRSYEIKDQDKIIVADVPNIVADENADVKSEQFLDEINKEIDSLVKKHVEESEQIIEEYKEAFMETGGTEEEFREKGIKANVSYDIKYQGDHVVSVVITSTQNWANAYTEQVFYNVDVKENKFITLKDVLGDDYVNIANEQILASMDERSKADSSIVYFDETMDGFKSIDDNTKFYLKDDNTPVIVFEKYEIGPGSIGIQEFEIVK